MSKLAVRNNAPILNGASHYRPRRVDLFRDVNEEFDRLFNQVFASSFFSNGQNRGYPKLDAVRADGKITFQYTVPGVKTENLTVEVTSDEAGKILTVSGRLSNDYTHDEDSYQIRELSSQEFRRIVRLPEDVEDGEPEATLKDGILTLSFKVKAPKVEPQPEVRRITVKSE